MGRTLIVNLFIMKRYPRAIKKVGGAQTRAKHQAIIPKHVTTDAKKVPFMGSFAKKKKAVAIKR